MFFSRQISYPIGLDISDLSLKLVQLKKKGDKTKIQALSRVELAKGIIETGEIKNNNEFLKKLKELITKPKLGSVNSNEVVACLPDTKTFIKLIEVEKSQNNIVDTIPAEIERHVPMSINEIYYDWQIINTASDKYLILIGAAPQNIVNQYIELLSLAGLTVIALEIEATAICRSLLSEENIKNKNQAQKNYAIIDIGAQRSNMIIYAKNTIVLSISIPISGGKITEKIASSLELKNEQAEKAKIICGIDKTKAQGIIYEILSDELNELNNRIKTTMDFYSNHYSNLGPINEIIICGGGANIKNIDQFIGQFNGLTARLGNVFINLGENSENIAANFTETHNLSSKIINDKQDKNLAVKQDSSLSFATAIGLALRNIYIN